MISLNPYMQHGLTDFLASMQIAAEALRRGGEFACDTASLNDADTAQTGLRTYHDARWPRVEGRGADVSDRMADLAELIGALYLMRVGNYQPSDVYPRCLQAAGRRVSEAGIDVTAVRIEDLVDRPLSSDESIHFLEAKHAPLNSTTSALDSLRTDLTKTDYERIADQLALVQSKLEEDGFTYPERVHRFMSAAAEMVLTVLFDPLVASLHECVESAQRRFSEAQTKSGIPVARFLSSMISDLRNWVSATM